LMKFN